MYTVVRLPWLMERKAMNQVSSPSLAVATVSHLVLLKRNRYIVLAFPTTESLFNDCKEEELGKGLFLLSVL